MAKVDDTLSDEKSWKDQIKTKIDCLDAQQKFRLTGLFFILLLIYQETIMYSQTQPEGFTVNYLSVLFFAVLNAVLFWGIIVLIPPKARRIVSNIFLLISTFLLSAQLIYYSFFRTYFIFKSMGQGGQIVEFMDIIVNLILRKSWVIILLFLPVLYYVFSLSKKKTDFKFLGRKRFVPLIVAIIVAVAVHALYLFDMKDKVSREYFLYLNRPYEASEFFGTHTAMGLDLRNAIFNISKKDPSVDNGYFVEPTIPNVTIPASTSSSTTEETAEITETEAAQFTVKATEATVKPTNTTVTTPAPTEPQAIVYQDNVLDIDFLSQAKQRDSETLKKMDLYFNSVKPSKKNKYSGIFEGYNLIVITAESYSAYVADPELTPTLYKMETEGFHLKNFYNPVWSVSTYDGEYVVLTSLYPKDGVWSLYHFADCYQAFSYPHRLPNYNSFAFHNHTYDYYSRDISHPAMGYEYYALGNGLEVTESWPESDLEMMQKSIDFYIDQEPFNIYYLTVSGHAAYSRAGNAMASKNYHRVEHLDLSEEAKCYLAANLELEDAMTYLLNRLREAGIADKTLIVLSPDHYPYALDDETFAEFEGGEVKNKYQLFDSAAIMYVDGMQPVEVEKPCANIDLMPTIYNLLAVPYDSRLLMGRDILSDSPGIVLFNDLSWYSEYGFYNSSTGEFTVNDDYHEEFIPEHYVETVKGLVQNRFYFSRLILEEDYYSKLSPLSNHK